MCFLFLVFVVAVVKFTYNFPLRSSKEINNYALYFPPPPLSVVYLDALSGLVK